MSRRIALSVVAGAVVLAGAGAFALAYAGDRDPVPALAHSAVHYTAPSSGRDGSLFFTTEVSAPSGVSGLKVLAWPERSGFAKKQPTAEEMAAVESATCTPARGHTVRCVYRTPVSAADASSAHGAWHIAVLATAKDGHTAFDTKAADFTVA
ncbi:DUF5707 domain-containing protein [Streptomyces sp. NPDC006655]|uniref:DUF5707 domain-containing protein n=1 Tax=Streptomyces sp. NPDC006655 TaxID=3156898 RepID=UPI0034513CF8